MNRDPTNAIKGYKINLQAMMGSKAPNSVLQFIMKHTYFKKVRFIFFISTRVV